uniref:SH2 domain-containing protein n=1 Tax=Trypanosoma congolense (strain IL3000) TaxID=1068625 RepID=G0UJL7_TRYCI|nr:conserved hypothetical protein [Trypanosoma congolense IL3000]
MESGEMMNTSSIHQRTLEQILTAAMWVMDFTDPALCLDRLHETFTDVIFSRAAEEPEEGEFREARRLKTAADRMRERQEKEALRKELMELQDDTFFEEDAEGSVSGELDGELTGDEDFSEGSDYLEDREFLSWIHRNDALPREDRTSLIPEADTAIGSGLELQLHRAGLGEEAERATKAILPERFRTIEMREHRIGLGSRPLPHGYSFQVSLGVEAFWIVRQLRGAGQPLAHNTRICALALRQFPEVEDHPVVVAVMYALQKMTQEYLEPAHLMLYHQTALQPLLFALLEASPLVEAAERTLPVASYAYSMRTGRRQKPFVHESYVGFSATGASRSIGEGDPAWATGRNELRDRANHLNGSHSSAAELDFAQRKPCFIELGRLLLRILELDILCHRLEWQRWHMLLKLKDLTHPGAVEGREMLSKLMFDSATEADFWQSFVSQITANDCRSAMHIIKSLGLESAFLDYTITGLEYQENLRSDTPIRLCVSPSSVSLMEWAHQISASTSSLCSPDTVLSLFNRAIIEQFSRLPLLRTRLFNVFCAEGDLIVTYKNSSRRDEVYPLARFFVEHSRHYLDLLERERQGGVELFYVLNEELAQREANFERFYDPFFTISMDSCDQNTWSACRQRVMELLLVRLVEGLIPKVKAELSQFANQCVQTQCVERFGLLCAQGPYQQTRLNLSAYDDDALLWDPEWNVVEALPQHEDSLLVSNAYGCKPLARVCAVYSGESGLAHICFVDENGSLIGTMRWMSFVLTSESGRAASLRQNIQLETLFVRCSPSVIAVGASNVTSLALMRSMLRFSQERVRTNLHIHVPVVWAPVEVARLYSATVHAESEMPSSDALSRTALALARYMQDPLSALSVLFDSSRTALRLSLGSPANASSEQEEQLYERLCWEMSLWVTACGVWVDHLLTRPISASLLQFVAGFGPNRARKAQQLLTSQRPINRRVCEQIITESFGEYVACNAACALRIGPINDGEGAVEVTGEGAGELSQWALLDQTLLPVAWYSAAAFIASAALNYSTTSGDPVLKGGMGDMAVADFMQLPMKDKRDRIGRNADQQDMTNALCKANRPEWASLLGEREVEFVQEEMIAAGQSFLRRPYRRLSTLELMRYITGITYCTKQNASFVPRSVEARPLVICEGDYITGTVQGIRSGFSSGVNVPSIRLTTSRGLSATISADTIDDDTMRQEFLEYESALRISADRSASGIPTPSAPNWLSRGALIQGTVVGCNYDRCELRLCWCRPRDNEARGGVAKEPSSLHARERLSLGGGMATPADYESGAMEDGNHISYAARVYDEQSCNTSLRTERLKMDVRVFATKVSRHPLFRDISSVKAAEFLRSKKIGEVLLRPASSGRNMAVAVVKIGEWSICNWLIREDRRPNGAIYYSLTDKVGGRKVEFNDVDEFLTNFISPMVSLAQGIRRHRRFVERARDVPAALDAQQESVAASGAEGEVSSSRTIAYAFIEIEQQSSTSFYRVVVRAGTRERNYYLHINDSYIYIRLPVRPSDRSGTDVKLLRCRNAEHVSELVKGLTQPS